MKLGKVSNTILKRSVLKRIKKRGALLQEKPSVGADCAVLEAQAMDELLLTSTAGRWPVYMAANNIAARGGEIAAVQCGITLSVNSEEQELKLIVSELERQCEILGIPISGGHTQVSEDVLKPVVQLTGIGYRSSGLGKAKPGQDIVAFGYIGVSGIRQIIEWKREEIQERYTETVIERAAGKEEELLIVDAAKLGVKAGVSCIHDVSIGGIYAAMWDMAEYSAVGLDIDFKKIPVRQEIIEICELFDVNPYELESVGCGLMAIDCATEVVRMLNAAGICASVIGRTTAENQKIIRNEDEIRYLDSPHTDEIFKFGKEIK